VTLRPGRGRAVDELTGGATFDPVPLCAALVDDSRWQILQQLGNRDQSASELAAGMPISRQAISKHLQQLESVGLVEAVPDGRCALGARLGLLAERLEVIGRGWDARLERLRDVAESVAAQEDEA
jgi:biotin operon repressor